MCWKLEILNNEKSFKEVVVGVFQFILYILGIFWETLLEFFFTTTTKIEIFGPRTGCETKFLHSKQA